MVLEKPLEKIFIIGLPRTGTTSICAALLELGISVAHTAYTERTFSQARAIADTPIFCDYQPLDIAYPGAKFIYLERAMDKWLPSISQLLLRMQANLLRDDGGFNPIIKRCYQEIFSPFSVDNIQQQKFLQACYERHQHQLLAYFKHRSEDLLTIDISDQGSYKRLLTFLGVRSPEETAHRASFAVLNSGGKVTAWKDIKSELKVDSTNKGRVTQLPYQYQT